MRLKQKVYLKFQARLDYTVRLFCRGWGGGISSHTSEGQKSKMKGLHRQTLFHTSLLALVTAGHLVFLATAFTLLTADVHLSLQCPIL